MTRFGRTYYPAKYTKWKQQAEASLRPLVGKPLSGPLVVDCVFWFAVPKSYSKRERENALNGLLWPRPDCDNLAKSVLDALTAVGAWDDDSQVVRLTVTKRYADAIAVRISS